MNLLAIFSNQLWKRNFRTTENGNWKESELKYSIIIKLAHTYQFHARLFPRGENQ